MLITFKCKADADVLMFGEVGRAMLVTLGKDPESRTGIITVAQLPTALEQLQTAMLKDKLAASPTPEEEEDEDAPRGMAAPVSFFQRAAPLVQMLEHAQREQVPVTWEAQG